MEEASQALSQENTAEEKQGSKNELVRVSRIFEGMDDQEAWEKENDIYSDYAKAMRMRNREPLEEDRFMGHFFGGGNFQESYAFGGDKDGYLLGSRMNGVFVPTHFAPAGLRQGYRLIKELVDSETPTALFLTQDLVETVQKMDGWKVLPFKIKANFRGEEVDKRMVINKWDAVPQLIQHQAGQEAKRTGQRFQDLTFKIKRLGREAVRLIQENRANANDVDKEVQAATRTEEYLSPESMAKLQNP